MDAIKKAERRKADGMMMTYRIDQPRSHMAVSRRLRTESAFQS